MNADNKKLLVHIALIMAFFLILSLAGHLDQQDIEADKAAFSQPDNQGAK